MRRLRTNVIAAAISSMIAGGASAQTLTTRVAEPVYTHAAVAADHAVASRAGVEMLERGGNAVDAAVAASFCLSVVRPASCGIGGGGFMIIAAPDGEHVAINYREVSPSGVGPDYYETLAIEDASRFRATAAGVPGTVAGLLYALDRYGTLDRATVLAPAIRAAEDGFPVDAEFVDTVDTLRAYIDEHPDRLDDLRGLWEQAREGRVRVGDIVGNPRQAAALRLIAEHGADAFYRGPIGAAIVRAVVRGGGVLDANDLASYQVRVGVPLEMRFRDDVVLSMPPPSSGGIAMQQIFGVLDRRLEATPATFDDPYYAHLLVEAMKHAFADRARWLADDAFVEVPIDRLCSPAYLDEIASRVDAERTFEPDHYGTAAAVPVDGGTSHISVIDAGGMAVACTETINLVYGSRLEVPEYGFALNNEMDDFTTIRGQPNAFGLQQSDRNLPEPGKRPLSSMSPTIVLRDGRPVVVAGASGGPRIITATTQAILNVLLFDMTPGDAVSAPRIHHQWMPNQVVFETDRRDEALVAAMRERGHDIGAIKTVGVVQLIAVDDDGIRAASDPRKGGVPAGY